MNGHGGHLNRAAGRAGGVIWHVDHDRPVRVNLHHAMVSLSDTHQRGIRIVVGVADTSRPEQGGEADQCCSDKRLHLM